MLKHDGDVSRVTGELARITQEEDRTELEACCTRETERVQRHHHGTAVLQIRNADALQAVVYVDAVREAVHEVVFWIDLLAWILAVGNEQRAVPVVHVLDLGIEAAVEGVICSD